MLRRQRQRPRLSPHLLLLVLPQLPQTLHSQALQLMILSREKSGLKTKESQHMLNANVICHLLLTLLVPWPRMERRLISSLCSSLLLQFH